MTVGLGPPAATGLAAGDGLAARDGLAAGLAAGFGLAAAPAAGLGLAAGEGEDDAAAGEAAAGLAGAVVAAAGAVVGLGAPPEAHALTKSVSANAPAAGKRKLRIGSGSFRGSRRAVRGQCDRLSRE
ncbi:MAG: hypothetical protein JOY61_14410 [Chloroflexi bacterium]|nr:hypothetical protein [Chloroflexota bacterium]